MVILVNVFFFQCTERELHVILSACHQLSSRQANNQLVILLSNQRFNILMSTILYRYLRTTNNEPVEFLLYGVLTEITTVVLIIHPCTNAGLIVIPGTLITR